jgi:hypothetical protein
MWYKVLAVYHPTLWKAWKVGRDLTRLTRELGLKPHYDPAHGPNKLTKSWYSDDLHAEVHKVTSAIETAEGWHYDGDTTPGSKPDCALVLWASSVPTEFRRNGDEEIYQPAPFNLVIVRNLSCVHRRPANCPHDRWLFRQRVMVPKWLHDT